MALTIEDLWLGIAGVTVVSGHMFSAFLSFKGGKGVATGFGVMLCYSPATAGLMLIIWILTAVVFRYSSLAALIAVAAMPVILVLLDASNIKVLISVMIALLIIFKHNPNIKNLIAGTESRIGDKSKTGK